MFKRTFQAVFVLMALLSLNVTQNMALAEEVKFEAYPTLDEKVNAFTQAFILGLLPEFDKDLSSFNFNIENSDPSRGVYLARFDGVTSREEIDGFSKPMTVSADIEFLINGFNEKEYSLDVNINGQVGETQTVTDFVQQALVPKCLENSAALSQNRQAIENICSSLGNKFSGNNNLPKENFKRLVEEWKKQALLMVENSEHKLGDGAEKLKEYIDSRIVVDDSNSDELYVAINISDIYENLGEEYSESLEKLKLNTTRVKKLEAYVNDQTIIYKLEVQKLFARHTVNKGLSMASEGLKTIEVTESLGSDMGSAVRDKIRGNNILSKLKITKGLLGAAGNAVGNKLGDAWNALGLGGSKDEDSEGSQVSEDEDDLGL